MPGEGRSGRCRPFTVTNTIPFRVQPMLATVVSEPFNRSGWTYEEKYDGIRILAYKEGRHVRLLSRNAIDRVSSFSGIAAAIAGLECSWLLLDGEVVLFDKKHVSRFQLLQRGGGEAMYAVFDCLYRQGRDLRREPLAVRRATLEKTVAPGKFLMLSSRLDADGLAAYRLARRKGFEGLVAKDLSSPYVEGRSKLWLKVKVHQQDEFVIGGFTKPSGSRKYFGALLLGAYEGKKLHYTGKVGTGFDEKTLAALHKMFVPLIRSDSSFAQAIREKDVTFLAPRLVAQVSYQEWTADGLLRQPVFLGLRDDKAPAEVELPRVTA
jgi:bifunctional non-homologous end joining protein LigD